MNFLMVASLTLAFAAAALWVRSEYRVDRVGRINFAPGVPTEDHHAYLFCQAGALTLLTGGDKAELFPEVAWQHEAIPLTDQHSFLSGDEPRFARALGVTWSNTRILITGETSWNATLRLRSLTAFFILIAAAAGIVRRRAARWPPGCCKQCGYDLRESVGRCPECGAIEA